MSKMLRLQLVGLVLLACTQILTEHRDLYGPRARFGYKEYRNREERIYKYVEVMYGKLRGLVVRPNVVPDLQLVDVFLGVPYAEPPVGSFRFAPPRSPQSWSDVRRADRFPPVCPQLLPKMDSKVKPGHYEYIERLLPLLKNQSEDCLYLNIYAPNQSDGKCSFYCGREFVQHHHK
ncbi:neuroligin-4, X-linked [Orussus abietinus]|uniref:neuroligin-4, X-linked n=1 Tax=Orussus abietinus TaxID=222816 RepID=UPI000C715E04|nr:neuroligin-4, X-linked [Orussus abietinus]